MLKSDLPGLKIINLVIKRIVVLCIFIFGLISPFIPSFVIIEMFFLPIPFGMIFFGTLFYIVITLFDKTANRKNAIFIFSFLPIFLLSQFLGVFTVDKIQKSRALHLITEIKGIRERNGLYPEAYNTSLGITYVRIIQSDGFELEYSRGFFVTERYNSLKVNGKVLDGMIKNYETTTRQVTKFLLGLNYNNPAGAEERPAGS